MDFMNYYAGGEHGAGEDGAGGQRRSNPRRTQKISRYALGAIGMSALFVGAWSLKSQVTSPFSFKDIPSHVIEASSPDGANLDFNLDTDADGIADPKEQYFYKTNPYLSDTDGDALSDLDEINKGSDPNCPEGKECAGGVEFGAPSVGGVTGEVSGAGRLDSTGAGTLPANADNLDADSLRQNLIKQGIDSATLNSIDDATLREVYEETLKETGSAGLNLPGAGAQAGDQGSKNFQNSSSLSAQEIREFLKQGGADDAMLNSVDDATLKTLYDEAIRKVPQDGSNQ